MQLVVLQSFVVFEVLARVCQALLLDWEMVLFVDHLLEVQNGVQLLDTYHHRLALEGDDDELQCRRCVKNELSDERTGFPAWIVDCSAVWTGRLFVFLLAKPTHELVAAHSLHGIVSMFHTYQALSFVLCAICHPRFHERYWLLLNTIVDRLIRHLN